MDEANILENIEGQKQQNIGDLDKITRHCLNTKETKTKKASVLTLNSQKYSCRMIKVCNKHKLQMDNKTYDESLMLTIFLSKYKQSQYSNSSVTSESSSDEGLAIVKFHVDQNTNVLSAFKRTDTVGYVKECFREVLDLDERIFSLSDLEGNDVDLSLLLKNIGVKRMQKIRFDVCSKTGETGMKNIIEKINENIPTLKVITVHTNIGGVLSDLIVEIEDQCCEKEWLGGFHNRKTNGDYHNAQTQTAPKARETVKRTEAGIEYMLYHRDTQTRCKPKNIQVDTDNNKATQMSRSDLFVASKSDKIIVPMSYVDYEHYCISQSVEKSVIIIQRAVKGWILRKRFRSVVGIEQKIMEYGKQQKEIIKKEEIDKERVVTTGSAYPVKREDFYMLYLMVGNWWRREWKRMNETRSKETKQAEVVAFLTRHVQLLREIEKQKAIGKKEALKKERMRFLNMMAQPITFKNSKGQTTSIDDLKTQRAREFKEIYSSLTRRNIPTSERIEVLLVLKNLISAHYMHYEYANDLISLIEREFHLLTTGFRMIDLKGLQMRIEQFFMNFLENQDCNPKAALYQKPNIPKTISVLIQCYRCKKLLPPSKYPVHVRMNKYNEVGCNSCTWMQNLGSQRVDMSPFVKLLNQVRNYEMEKCCYSAVCFIFQPIGMQFLTMKIWHGHSAISECRDVSKLQHVRWLSDVEWAPWNTILLTNQEAKCHRSIPDVFQFYDQSFIDSVQQKHILAQASLEALLRINHDICSSEVWANIKDQGVYLHPSHAEAFAADNEYDKI